MTPELGHAIENLYVAFASYAKPTKIEVCPCGCTRPDATAPLLANPLRSVPYEAIRDFAFSALTTQGSVDDFRYFLPRLFEGLVEFNFNVDPEVVLGKLAYANWRKWPVTQILAIEEFFAAMWRTALSTYPVTDQLASFGEIETALCSISQTGLLLKPFLEVWSHTHNGTADLNLIQLVALWGADLAQGSTLNVGFWNRCQAQAQEVRQWILQPDTMERIREIADLLPNEGYEHLLPEALQTLEIEFERRSR